MLITTYIPYRETAKNIRKILKENFAKENYPTLLFKMHRVAGGSQLIIDWKNGPSLLALEAIVTQFQKSRFELKSSEKDKFGPDYIYISCRRRISRTFVDTMIDQFCSKYNADQSKIRFFGDDVSTWIDASALGYQNETALVDLLNRTDERDMLCAYEANMGRIKREQENRIRNEAAQRAKAELRREQEKRQNEEKKRQQEQRQRSAFTSDQRKALSSRQNALAYFNLPYTATQEDIMRAFRAKVKSSADGQGGYTIDMDLLVKIKEKALL